MRERFAQLADAFIEEVRQTPFRPDTEVFLIYHCLTQARDEVSFRILLAPIARITIPGAGELAASWEETLHRQVIINDINSLVRAAPEGFVCFRGGPAGMPLRVVDFEIQVQPPPAGS